jgi:primosomal protein N' (replication factor Y)
VNEVSDPGGLPQPEESPRHAPQEPGEWVEVAVALPLRQTFTYRNPYQPRPLRLGTQVTVPFGPRVVTGFVVGHPATAPGPVKDVLDVLDADTLLEAEVLELCRWAASYYLSPLGEVLKTALPQGQRASSRRGVRLAPEGERVVAQLRGLTSGGLLDLTALTLDEGERALLLRLAKAGSLGLRALQRDQKLSSRVERLIRAHLLEVGDEVTERDKVPTVRVAFAAGHEADVLPKLARAPAQATLWKKLRHHVEAGVLVEALTPPERTALRAMVGRGAARVEARAPTAVATAEAVEPAPQPILNRPQQEAFEVLTAALSEGFSPFLLQGITGSGKTEVYLRVIAEARRAGKGALVLVPEIALTPQLASRFRARFGDDVAVLHSALPPAERLRAWRRLHAGQVGIALGARSAVFAPLRNLGIVVVDEEHDPSFKQDEGVRYHGRDLALVRARQAAAVAVLGSATPSLESFHNVGQDKYGLLRLPVRAAPGAAERPLPEVEIIDLRRFRVGSDGLLSKPLADAISETIAAGEQVILFLNRRGFATVVLCRACGHVVRCPDCEVSMTFHRGVGRIICHYCGRSEPPPHRCPACNKPGLEHLGIGTERVEAVVRERFPSARVVRLDRDTAGPAGRHDGANRGLESILAQVHAREVDILVGTQMVTKGHDFPGVTLVGVLQPDQGMHLPDFRASERTFQLLEQVAGRAGRADRPGRVLVQTYNPLHAAISALRTHDYEGFALGELEHRQHTGFPPLQRLVAIRIDGPDAALVEKVANDAAERARAAGGDAVRILGPAEAPIPRLRGRVRWQVWLAAPTRRDLVTAAEAAATAPLSGDVRLAVDVDPQRALMSAALKFLIIAGPYEADLVRRAAVAAECEAIAIEAGDSLSGWVSAARPDAIVMTSRSVKARVKDAIDALRALPGGNVPIVMLCDAVEQEEADAAADLAFVRPVAPQAVVEAARGLVQRRRASQVPPPVNAATDGSGSSPHIRAQGFDKPPSSVTRKAPSESRVRALSPDPSAAPSLAPLMVERRRAPSADPNVQRLPAPFARRLSDSIDQLLDAEMEQTLSTVGVFPSAVSRGATEEQTREVPLDFVNTVLADARHVLGNASALIDPSRAGRGGRREGFPAAGELASLSIPLLLGIALQEGVTGRLRVRQSDAEKSVFFEAGRPVLAVSSVVSDRMVSDARPSGHV